MFWKKGHLDDVKTYIKDWISIIVLTILLLIAVNAGLFTAVHFRGGQIALSKWIPISIGICIIMVGLYIRIWCVKTLRNFFRLLIIVQKNQKIITNGPYRYLRHPSYSAALLSLIGLGLCIGNWVTVLLFFFPPLIGYLIRIRLEEEVMINHFGKLYIKYQKKTPWKLIPFVL